MSNYPTVFHQGGYVMFSGFIGQTYGRTSTIARFDESTRTWSKLREVLTSRSSHGAIYTGESFLVIGVWKSGSIMKLRTEKCDIKNESVSCQYHPWTLENLRSRPE